MRLEVGGVDHQALGLTRATCEPSEDAVEHAEAAPAHEAVVQGLVWAVLGRRVAPAQPVADDMEDTADYPLIVHPRHAV